MSTNKSRGRRTAPANSAPGHEVVQRFGSRLREARGARTLRDVSLESGVSIAYISDLERGNLQNPSLTTLRKIATALDVSLDSLLGEDPAERNALPELPASLRSFANGALFTSAMQEMADRWKLDERLLTSDWLHVLATIDIAGRRPQSEADWMFVFEAIRRALDS